MRPSLNVLMSCLKMTCELFTAIQPTPSRMIIDCVAQLHSVVAR